MPYQPLGIIDDMPFGKYKARNIGELIDEDPGYMHFLLNARNKGFFDEETERFIDEAMGDE